MKKLSGKEGLQMINEDELTKVVGGAGETDVDLSTLVKEEEEPNFDFGPGSFSPGLSKPAAGGNQGAAQPPGSYR